MSLLLGVRGSDQKKEGQAFRENIIQQPGSFYNGNPSSSIWGSPPLQSLWCELPLADAILSSPSSTAVPTMSSSSSTFKNSVDMAEEKSWEEKPWQDMMTSDAARDKGFNPSKAEAYGYISSNIKQNGKLSNTNRTSAPLISPLSFGYSPQSTALGNDRMDSFTFPAKEFSQEFRKNGKAILDEGGRLADMEPNSTGQNEKNWKHNPLAMQQKSISGSKMRVLGVEADSCSDGNTSRCSDVSESKQTNADKKTPEVFVFGARGSGGSSFKASAGGSSFKASVPQQKSFQGSFAASSSRSRSSKFKRHSNVLKGKGLAPIGGLASQQCAPTFSRDASPQSNTGLESATELDEAECSDAGIWPEDDNIDLSINFEEDNIDKLRQSELMQEDKSGGTRRNERPSMNQEGLLSTDNEGLVSQFNPNWQDHVSSNQKPQEEYSFDSQETQHGSAWQTLGARFGSWWPFQGKTEQDSRESWETDDFLKASKEKDRSAHLVDVVDETHAVAEQGDSNDLNSSSSYTKLFQSNLQSSSGGLPEAPEPSDGRSSKFKFAGKFGVEEPTLNMGSKTVESVWNANGKESAQPFVFRAAQQQADYSGEWAFGRSGATAASKSWKDEGLQESLEGFTTASSAPIASGLSSPSAAFSVGTNLSSAVYKEPASVDNQSFSRSSVSTASKPHPVKNNNVDFVKGVQLSSFTEHDKEGPTGEFSGPLSRSESSASEGSPLRGEPWPATDKPFNQIQRFEFQGSVKDGSSAQMATGKKKSQNFSKIKKHVRGINRSRSRRATQSTSFKNVPVPMDFSPIANDMELSSGATPLEQPYFNLSGTNMDHSELLRQLSQFQNMTEFAAASASVENDEDITDFQVGNQAFEASDDWTEHNPFSSKRSEKWKRRGLIEGRSPPPYQESQGFSEHPEKGDMSATDEYILQQEISNNEQPLTFGASSSSMHHRYVRRPQREKSPEPPEEWASASTTVRVPADSVSLDQGRQFQLKPGPGLSFVSAPVDNNFLSGASRTSSNVNHTFARSSEESAPANTHSSHHSAPGIPEGPNTVKSAAAEQVCERWRLRGNQAYANGDFPKAEECYSRGASSVSPDETSQSCIRASMLCYSNRAATRMAIGRMREALADCKRAMVVDPGFLRVRLRAASCHLALGESKAAADTFKECLKYAKEIAKPDSKIVAEAMEGLKKSQQLDDYSDRAFELLQKQNFMDSTSALRLLNEALSISSFSEQLHELKVQVLLSLRRYEECLLFCEQTLPAAERNHGSAVLEKHQDSYLKEPCQSHENVHLKLWRWRLSAKALYHLGKLEDSLELLVKHEDVVSTCPIDKITISESLATFLAFIHDLLRHKAAGNEAFQLGKHAEAVEHYTAALACNGDSRPFNAVCFCNRAAASQALGHIADAIADCSRAIALDAIYPKALSRRATLHEMIRDYGQACNDLRRLITLLEDNNNDSSKGVGYNINAQDLQQAKERLDKGEEEMKKGHPIDHYLVLGVDFSCSANEIKKAYRKAALKHHPDKAGQFLARSDVGDDGGLWKEVGDEVRRDTERLFKLIGEAYAILSDATKRLRYDMDEENRKLRGKDISNQVSTSASEGYRSQYEKSGRRQRDRWDTWQAYAPQHQRWQSGPDAAQPDTYGRRSTYGVDSTKTGRASWNTDFSWDKL